MDLSLDLGRGVRSVDQALKNFTAVEMMEGDNKWKCGCCNRKVRAEKGVTVFKVILFFC